MLAFLTVIAAVLFSAGMFLFGRIIGEARGYNRAMKDTAWRRKP